MKLSAANRNRNALTVVVAALALGLVGCTKKTPSSSSSPTGTNSMAGMHMAMSGMHGSMTGMNMNMHGMHGSMTGMNMKMPGMKSSTSSSNGTRMPMPGMTGSMTGMNMNMHGMHGSMTGTNMKMPGMTMTGTNGSNGSTGAATVPNRVPVNLDQEQSQFIDIRTQPVHRGDAVVTIRTVGIITYDQTRLANVNTRISGWAQKLYVDKPGQYVKQGEPLMDIYSPSLYSAQYEYLLAYRQYHQLQHVPAADRSETNDVVWRDSVQEARGLMNSARKRLELWEVPNAEITALEKTGQPKDTLQLHAPFSGYVIQKNIDPGQMVRSGMTLYRVADLSTVWINAQIYEYELPYVKVGQRVRVTALAHPGRVFKAKVDFLYPYAENRTRTTTARLVMNNRAGLFKPADYVNAEIQANEGQHLLIPSSAVYDTGVSQYVFIEAKTGHFVPQRVVLGPHVQDNQVVIQQGLTAGQKIVVDGNFFLDSESQLRAASAGG